MVIISVNDWFEKAQLSINTSPVPWLNLTLSLFQNPQQTPLNNQFSQVVGETSRIAEWAKGFDKLLEDPDGVAYFQDFLKKEYADENIKFWLACRKYEGMSDQKKVRPDILIDF